MSITIRHVLAVSEKELAGLTALLADCVEGGASVGFMQPFEPQQATAFWRAVAQDVKEGRRALLVAQDGERIVGTVQLALAQPDNQGHRADLCKMLVAPSARRQGVGAALLDAAERVGRDLRKTLLVLDTANAEAERLYERAGWQRVGTIPGYALWPQGGTCATTYFYRELG